MSMKSQAPSRSRRLLLGVATLAVVSAAIFGLMIDEAEAGPAFSKDITYFATPAKVTVVGIYEVTCSGTVLSFGQKTRHKTEVLIPCF